MQLENIQKRTHKMGYNTRDNPAAIPSESCQQMVNMFPSDPSPRPRLGCWYTFGETIAEDHVTNLFSWDDATSPKIIFVTDDGKLCWAFIDGVSYDEIGTDLFSGVSTISFVRVNELGYFFTSSSDAGIVIKWNGTDFDWYTNWIDNFSATIAVTEIGGGAAFPASKVISLKATWVRREDAASKDVNGDPQLVNGLGSGVYHPGELESQVGGTITHTCSGTDQDLRFSVTYTSGQPTWDTVTHLRIYGTLAAQSEVEAQGLSHRWFCDIPIVGPNADASPAQYDFTVSQGTVAGQLIFLNIEGYEFSPPAASKAVFAGGRMWLASISSGKKIGRIYYSEIPIDIEYPQKWYLMFRAYEYFKDAALDDIDEVRNIAYSGDDLYIFLERNLYYLPDSDAAYQPKLLAVGYGTKFTNTVCINGEQIFYLSNKGPAVIQRRNVDLIRAHTAGEVWPITYLNASGYFFAKTSAEKATVQGWYFRDTFWLADENKCVGFYIATGEEAGGSLEVVFAHANLKVGLAHTINEDYCVMCSTTDTNPELYLFLHPGYGADIGEEFTMKLKTKQYYFFPENQDFFGEMYKLIIRSKFTDTASMNMRLIIDKLRYEMNFIYEEFPSDDILSAQGKSVAFREVFSQVFPEGMSGHSFEIEFTKLHRTPYDFQLKGFKLEFQKREGYDEFSSDDWGELYLENLQNTLLYLKFDADSANVEDFAPGEKDHVWDAGTGGARTHDTALFPNGGESYTAGTLSKVKDTDWTDSWVVGSDGLVQPEVWEVISSFPSLSSIVTLLQGPGSTSGSNYKIQVNTDGSLQAVIYTKDSGGTVVLEYKYTTPAGSVSAGSSEYFIQFSLSNFGNNGAFYLMNLTSGVFSTLLTTRSALI